MAATPISDWPLLNALLNTASGATWVSFHHGGGVGMGYSQHAGMVIVADGTDDAARRLERVLWNDPGTGVMRHADAGYDIAMDCAREQGLDLPMVNSVKLNPENVTLDQLRELWIGADARLDDAAMQRVAAAAASVERIVAGGETVYGVNTGFGLLANTRIPDERLAELQTNLILSHSAGLGDPLPRHVTRLMIVLKLLGLGRGYSGVRPVVIEALQALLDRDAMPVIPSQGSVGASGDLAPLAHMTAALMGHGSIDVAGEIDARRRRAREARDAAAQARAQGRPCAHQRHANVDRARARRLVRRRAGVRRSDRRRRAVGRCAERQRPSRSTRASRALRGQPGQIRVAAAIAGLLEGSDIVASHATGCTKVQDPYSFRCQPQVMGAALDLLDQCRAHADHRGRRGDRQPDRLPG